MTDMPIRLSDVSRIEKVSKGKLDLMNRQVDILDLVPWDTRSIVELNLSFNNLVDLKGIQQFKNAKYLDLSNNNVRIERAELTFVDQQHQRFENIGPARQIGIFGFDQ